MDIDLASIIGRQLRTVRKTHRWTQAQAAHEVGLSHEFYARIERGQAFPSVPTLLRIVEVMGTSMQYLLGEAIQQISEEMALESLTHEIEYITHFARENPEHIYLLNLVLKTFEKLKKRD